MGRVKTDKRCSKKNPPPPDIVYIISRGIYSAQKISGAFGGELQFLVHFWNSKPLLTGFQSSLSHHDTQLGAEGTR